MCARIRRVGDWHAFEIRDWLRGKLVGSLIKSLKKMSQKYLRSLEREFGVKIGRLSDASSCIERTIKASDRQISDGFHYGVDINSKRFHRVIRISYQ